MIDFNLNSFMTNYRDFARSYLFKCKIDSLQIKYGLKNHEFLVKVTELPDQSITEISGDFQGNKYKIGGTTEYSDFNVTFRVDSEADIRKTFIKWHSDIHNPSTNFHGKPNDYFSDITLEQINSTNHNPIIIYNLIGAWPKNIGKITLDYSSKEISTFDVSFAYQYSKLNTINIIK